MTECIHGLDQETCDVCASESRGSRRLEGTMAGKSFALVFAPSLRADTFLHLNREGDHWKFRWYQSPNRGAVELAQSGKATTRMSLNLKDVEFVHEISYPYSTKPGGESIRNSQYWFDEIARRNAEYNLGHN